MDVHTFTATQDLDGTPEEVFPFFADAFNLEAITPPLLRFRVITPPPVPMGVGTFIQYRLRIRGVPVLWNTLIQEWEPSRRFVDVQVKGPYRLWHHTHTFEPLPGGRTRMTDTVRYAIGFGPLGALAHRVSVERDVRGIFEHRAQVIPALLERDRAARTPVPTAA